MILYIHFDDGVFAWLLKKYIYLLYGAVHSRDLDRLVISSQNLTESNAPSKK